MPSTRDWSRAANCCCCNRHVKAGADLGRFLGRGGLSLRAVPPFDSEDSIAAARQGLCDFCLVAGKSAHPAERPPPEGDSRWTSRRRSVNRTRVVVWPQFGITERSGDTSPLPRSSAGPYHLTSDVSTPTRRPITQLQIPLLQILSPARKNHEICPHPTPISPLAPAFRPTQQR